MGTKSSSIPVKPLAKEFDKGIAVRKISFDGIQLFEQTEHSHRHNYHFFLLLEKGNLDLEIDFERYSLKKNSIVYIHPDQVHKIIKRKQSDFYMLAIDNESLHSEYLKMLEQIVPARPLVLGADSFLLLVRSVVLVQDFLKCKQESLYRLLLQESTNTAVTFILSQYMQSRGKAESSSRFEVVTKAFKAALEQHFLSSKRPSDYAQLLNISTPYLNECVRKVTGFPVSHHIQQRLILEAKRLLVHTQLSVKEIASTLGYEDYAYFSRLFAQKTGTTALTFRNKNLD
jgi:AraC family transcriptional activator of pobA